MKKYKNIIIAFFVGVLASLFVLKGISISKKKQIRKDRIEKRMDMKKDPILNDSIREARIQMLKEKKRGKRKNNKQ
tara:strand:+ start:2046 stop:2273 length:228 start_codon:yes stop_codon:yes gene_type:complete